MQKNYITFTFIFLFFVANYAQNTAIPDANFEQALIDLNIDSDNTINGSVLTSDIENISYLYIPSKNISDLTGIQDFTRLITLVCYDNQLTSLDLSNNPDMTTLQGWTNQLTSIDVTQNTNLSILAIAGNQLTSIDISHNTKLSTLGINSNQLTSLDMTHNTALFYLQCQGNQLTDLDLSQNTALGWLVCGSNLFTSIDLKYNTALTKLTLMRSQVTTLDLSQNTLLTELNCTYNDFLTNLNLSQNSELSILNINNDPVLATLDVTHNTKLTKINCYHAGLTALDLSQNIALTEFTGYQTPFTSLDFSNNPAITRLNCSSNQQLTALNVKNGNNTSLTYLDTMGCLNLECIQVDDEAAANAATDAPYTNWYKDNSTIYSEDCAALGIEDLSLATSIRLFPNPVTSVLHIDSEIPLSKVELFSILGKKVMELTSDFNTIPMAHLANGLYIVKLQSENGSVTKKLIKE